VDFRGAAIFFALENKREHKPGLVRSWMDQNCRGRQHERHVKEGGCGLVTNFQCDHEIGDHRVPLAAASGRQCSSRTGMAPGASAGNTATAWSVAKRSPPAPPGTQNRSAGGEDPFSLWEKGSPADDGSTWVPLATGGMPTALRETVLEEKHMPMPSHGHGTRRCRCASKSSCGPTLQAVFARCHAED
jgi:hypothetical protein